MEGEVMKGSKCKACGARDISGLMGPTPDWECGSYMREDGSIHQSDRCRAKELEETEQYKCKFVQGHYRPPCIVDNPED